MAFILKTETELCKMFYVTPEQIDKASRVIDEKSGKVFYQVESASEPGKLYEVRYNTEYKRLTCTCKAGEAGYGCWHRRATWAAQYEYRQRENLQARLEAGDKDAREQQLMVDHRNSFERHMRELEEQRTRNSAIEGFHILK